MYKWIFAAVVAAGLTLAFSQPGIAGHGHRSHFHSSIWIGPSWSPYWYAPPPAVVHQPIIVQQPPTEYVQRDSGANDQESEQDYWYYCPDADGYYPYVKKCPSRWMKVVPPSPGDEEDMQND
jgi:hypothetical protein